MAMKKAIRVVKTKVYLQWLECAHKLLDAASSIMNSNNLSNIERDDPALYMPLRWSVEPMATLKASSRSFAMN